MNRGTSSKEDKLEEGSTTWDFPHPAQGIVGRWNSRLAQSVISPYLHQWLRWNRRVRRRSRRRNYLSQRRKRTLTRWCGNWRPLIALLKFARISALFWASPVTYTLHAIRRPPASNGRTSLGYPAVRHLMQNQGDELAIWSRLVLPSSQCHKTPRHCRGESNSSVHR